MAYVFHMMPENELTKLANELEAKVASGTGTEADANTLDLARRSLARIDAVRRAGRVPKESVSWPPCCQWHLEG